LRRKPCGSLLDPAAGGTWGGAQGIDGAIFPLGDDIDSVRHDRRN